MDRRQAPVDRLVGDEESSFSSRSRSPASASAVPLVGGGVIDLPQQDAVAAIHEPVGSRQEPGSGRMTASVTPWSGSPPAPSRWRSRLVTPHPLPDPGDLRAQDERSRDECRDDGLDREAARTWVDVGEDEMHGASGMNPFQGMVLADTGTVKRSKSPIDPQPSVLGSARYRLGDGLRAGMARW